MHRDHILEYFKTVHHCALLLLLLGQVNMFLSSREELLVSHRAPPPVADRGMLTRYGGYRGNKIPGADQN